VCERILFFVNTLYRLAFPLQSLALSFLNPSCILSVSCEKIQLDSKRKELGTCFSQRWRCLRLILRLELMGLLSSLWATHPSMPWPYQVSLIHQFFILWQFLFFFLVFIYFMNLLCVMFWLFWSVIMGLKDRFDEAARRNDVKAIVLTGNCIGLFVSYMCDDFWV